MINPRLKMSHKNKLDKFCSNRDLMYDYKTELTEIGSRSFVNNFSDNVKFVYIMFYVVLRA